MSQELAVVLQKIQESRLASSGFSANFKQEFFSALRQKTVLKEGQIEYKSPKSFRWELKAPTELYLSNGKVFWKYSEEAKHAQKLDAAAIGTDFLNLLFQVGELSQTYQISPWEDVAAKSASQAVLSDAPPPKQKEVLFVKLVPKKQTTQEKIYLSVEEKSGWVQELRIVYRNGNRWRVDFSNYRNQEISNDRFEFSPPAGIAVDGK